MARWRSLDRGKALLRFRLRSLLVMVAFAGVLLGWWSDRQRMEERLGQREDLLRVLRAAEPEQWGGEGFGWSGFQLGSLSILQFDDVEQFLSSLRDGSMWKKPDGSFRHLMMREELQTAVIPRIVPFLTNADADVRYRAAYALHQFAKPPSGIVPDLLAAVSDECPQVREEVMGALRAVEGPVEGLGARLSVCLNADDPDDLRILLAMISSKDPAFDLTERIAGFLAHSNPKTRAAAAEYSMAPDTSPDVMAGLLAMLDDREPNCRAAAAKALQRAPTTTQIMDRLIRAFKSEDDEKVRGAIARTVEALHRK